MRQKPHSGAARKSRETRASSRRSREGQKHPISPHAEVLAFEGELPDLTEIELLNSQLAKDAFETLVRLGCPRDELLTLLRQSPARLGGADKPKIKFKRGHIGGPYSARDRAAIAGNLKRAAKWARQNPISNFWRVMAMNDAREWTSTDLPDFLESYARAVTKKVVGFTGGLEDLFLLILLRRVRGWTGEFHYEQLSRLINSALCAMVQKGYLQNEARLDSIASRNHLEQLVSRNDDVMKYLDELPAEQQDRLERFIQRSPRTRLNLSFRAS
jgi:hypothetical protein